jgi:hypothetical protein
MRCHPEMPIMDEQHLPFDDFLATLEALTPWDQLAALIGRHDDSGALVEMARLLRLHTVQQRYGWSDEALLQALRGSPALRQFAGIGPAAQDLPDADAMAGFRRMLQERPLAAQVLSAVAPPAASLPVKEERKTPKPRASRKAYVWRFA